MRLTFAGAVRGVTGSCFLLETRNSKILIDCGMYQGSHALENSQEPFDFDPKNIDAVLITHAHYDHTGRLPLLTKQGFGGKIFMTPPTKPLTGAVLDDAHHVMVENFQKYDTPILFDESDIEKVDDLAQIMNYHTEFSPIKDIKCMFYDAGHILGSAFIKIEVEDKVLIFSGDIGNEKVPILPETEEIEVADYIITESTYGNREHEPVQIRTDKLKKVIDKIIGQGGTLIIPAFSVERTQELLYELDQLSDAGELPKVPIYLDSPLAIKVTEYYQHYKQYLRFDRPIFSSPDRDFFSFDNLHITLNVDDSRAINDDLGPKIIIAGSGMMQGGRVMHHLKRYLSDKKSGVLIIGHQAEGTLGRRIYDGADSVQIHGDVISINAEINAIGAFSSHADRIKLRSWLKPKQGIAEKIFLVHGDVEVKESFKQYLEQSLYSEIIIPQYWQMFEL